jgi:hypothetical protein
MQFPDRSSPRLVSDGEKPPRSQRDFHPIPYRWQLSKVAAAKPTKLPHFVACNRILSQNAFEVQQLVVGHGQRVGLSTGGGPAKVETALL